MVQFFRDLSLRGKLFCGFGVVLALNVVMGLVLISQLGSVNAGSDYLGKRVVPTLRELGQLGHDVADYRRAELKYVLAGDAKGKALARADITADESAVRTVLRKRPGQFHPNKRCKPRS